MLVVSFQRSMADVLAVLHAVEADALEPVVGPCAGNLYRIAERGYAKHPAAAGHEVLALESCPGMEHLAVGSGLGQPADEVAFTRLIGITVRRDHHAEGRAPVPLRFDLVEGALERALDEL